MKDNLITLKNEYKPLCYWGWLENILPDEVIWQIDQMYDAGLGGYVMHARGGLEIPYMGDQWMESVKAMVKKGKELEMLTVVDDEDGWPSGFGAGIVNGMGEHNWQKWLVCDELSVNEAKYGNNTIGFYLLNDECVQYISDFNEIQDSSTKIIHIYYESNKYYVDNLDPKVVREFIDASYEKYYKQIGNEFGKGVYAIFSDEPQIARGRITWSSTLPDEFCKRCGYDIIKNLPALFYDIKNSEKIRYDYWQTVNQLFISSYAKQIGEWCSGHNVNFTGHTLLEEHLPSQLMGSSGTMPFYEYMHIPGIDWLDSIPVSNFAVKQVSSVAQQLGKRRVLCEMFGCSGWNVSFEELKWIGEWHYLLGVNMMLQHLGLYSLKGSRKREYPPSLFYQQPWWKEFKTFNDYFSRLSYIMVESEPVIDILMIHPLKSAWIKFDIRNFTDIENMDVEIKKLTDNLMALNYDFHFGDEEIICKYGRVRDNSFIVGNHSYKMVIIPPSVTLDKSTFQLIRRFQQNGGMVLSVGRLPWLIEGEPCFELDEFRKDINSIKNGILEIKNKIEELLQPRICINPVDGSQNIHIYTCMRKTKDKNIYFIVNTSKYEAVAFNINFLQLQGRLCKLDLIDCNETEVDPQQMFSLEPLQSFLLLQEASDELYNLSHTDKSVTPKQNIESIASGITNECLYSPNKIISFNNDWHVINSDINSVVLDYCSYRIDGGNWQEKMPVILLQEKLISLQKPVNIEMKFDITVEDFLEEFVYLSLEEPDKFSIEINDIVVDYIDSGWWIDKSFRKIEIGKYLIKGKNEIVLKRHFICSEKVYRIKNDVHIHEAEANRITIDTEIENIYLLGHFNVGLKGNVQKASMYSLYFEGDFYISKPKSIINIKDLVCDGYPFFAGTVTLNKEFHICQIDKKINYILKLGKPDAIVIKLYINNQFVKTFTWSPYEFDISELIIEGTNTISLDLITSCRNLFGPHHNKYGEVNPVSPMSFTDKNWSDFENKEYEKIWTDRYCFVNFGIAGEIDVIASEK